MDQIWSFRKKLLSIGLITVILVTLSGCLTAGPSQTTQTTQTTATASSLPTSQSATTGSTTATSGTTTTGSSSTDGSTPISSQNQNRDQFSQADLIVNGISYGTTPEAVETALGKPVEKKTWMEEATGHDLLSYDYDGLLLTFSRNDRVDDRFHLRAAEATSSRYRFAHDLKVGDPASTVILSFAQNKTTGKYLGNTVLYGNPDSLESGKERGEIAFGYYSNEQAYYLYMDPPYMTGYASVYDDMAVLQFTFTNHAVSRIQWFFGAGAE
jgi:hypothetical protein